MAGFRKIYTSQNQYLEDVARSTGLFDDDYYNIAKESKKDLEYITLMANAKDNISSTFDKGVYDRLSGEERFKYFATENFMDKSSQEYKDSQAYFGQRIQQIKNEEIFNSLNDFEKTMRSIGGLFGNMTLQLGGLVEGLVDVGALAAGAVGGIFDADFAERMKNFVSEDATGYNAAQQSMNDWINKYTFLDKNIIAKGINDITTGIVRMTPMLLGYALAVPTGGVSTTIGTTIYYASMAGNTAEEAVKANPDINYGSLLGYTAGTVGLEALTEWASGKLFSGDIISKMAFGGKTQPAGNILKGLLGNFGTEAFEESVSELFGSMMYKHLVDPTANVASVEDILYAAVIGGLTGSLLFGADVVLKTKRMSVVDGKLVETKTLTPEQRKAAKNLGLRKSYNLQSMLSQAQEILQQPTNVTKLMTKYGTSLQDIQQNHAEEYANAVEQDTQTKKNQADSILALANLMQTIGIEQFTKSAKFLEENLVEAEQAIYNFNNHTDTNNKRASEAFKTLYPNETFTPVAIPTKAEQTLATELRKILPGTMVSFGSFGNPEGLAKASINQGGNFIFIKSGLVEQMGFDAALNEVIKYEIAQDVMRQLPVDEMKKLIKYATEDDVEYDKLSHDQKLTVAQMICFDPVFNQKTFLGDKKTHLQIYNYLNKEIKKTGLPKVKFNNLLKIRNTFLNSIANFVANQEDLDTIQKKYELSDEELQEKIARFTTITNFNNRMRLADLDLAKQSISKCYAQKELESHLETEGAFDWNRLYDETYYDDDYVAQIKGDNPDFKEALIIHLSNVYNTDFNAIALASMERYVKENMSEQEVRKVADEILTKDFVKNTTNLSDLQTEVANKMWWLTQLDIAKTDLDVDSIIVTDDQIKGTGKLNFIIGDISDGDILLSGEQRRDARKSTRDLFRRVPSDAATYTTNTRITNLEFSMQDDSTIDEHQKALVNDYKNKTGLTLHFFKDAVVYKGKVREQVQGFVNGTDVYVRYDGTLTNDQLNKVMEHEATHKRRDAEPEKYDALQSKIEKAMTPEAFNDLYVKYERLYEPIYGKDDPRIEEEMVINIAVGIEKPSYKPNEDGNVKALIKGFMKTSTKLMKQKISDGVRFSRKQANVGYHYGDISYGKKADVREIMPGRGTGHFGTGYYFVGYSDTKNVPEQYLRRNRDVVDFSQYNLFVPKTYNDAYALHEALQAINDASFAKTPNSDFVLDEFNKRIKSPAKLESFLLGQGFNQQDVLDIVEDVEAGFNGRAEDKIKKILTEWSESFDALYNSIYKLSQILNVSETKLQQVVMDAITRKTQDSASTLVMKALGYEGIDVRHIPQMDNFSYGSVIYDVNKKSIIQQPEFSLDVETSNETKNIKSSSNATTPKQIADAITSIIANSPMAYSESKGFEGAEMEYTKVAQSMIDENFGLFRKVNQGNYQQIRDNIAKTDAPYTQQALVIFDRALFTYAEDSSRFDDATQEKIKNQARQTQTISAQWQGLQSRRLADKTSLTEIKNKFAEDGYDISVSNETVTNYVPEMKNKEKFIKQIDEDIAKIESQIDDAKDSVEKAALNKELKDATEKRMVMDKGTNEEIMDWVITNEDIVNRASKIQKEIFEQMVDKAEKAAETPGKKAITILVDEKTGLPKPFPKATQWIEKNVKRLKSFRMWAMLTSPVSWVRNWVGNAGMTALDGVTNQLEKWMTTRLPQIDVAKLEQQAKELNIKKTLTDAEKTKLAEINAQIQQAYDFKFVETTASKELKQQIAKEYEFVFQQILNGEDISKYEGSAEKAGAIARAEREITRKSENANFVQKVWAACQSMTDWGLNTGWFGDNAVVLNSLVKNFANMVESNKTYLIKSLTTEYGKDGRGMSAERKALVEKALNTKNSMDIVNAMSKSDVELFMDSCKQRTFEQYFKNSNWLSKWASNLSQKHPIAASLTSLVLPFPKVAANIMTMAYKYSPLGFISALRQWSVVKQMDAAGYEGVRDAFARAKLTRTTAQATVGTVMCIAGLILASLGVIDIDDDDYLGPALHIGDLRISLSNLAPSMTTFSVGAAMMWAWKNDQSAALKALDVLYDNTLLGNIENVFRYGDPTKYIENLSINYVSQYVPAMLKLFAKFTTNQAMIDKSGSYFEKLSKTFVSGIPFAANLLPKKINPYTGEFLTNTGSQNVFFNFMEAISPLDFETTNKSKTQKEAERLGTESSGLTGKFKVNDKEYDIDKVTYSKYRATYIQNTFDNIMNGKQKVTVEDENGKRITTTYDKLTNKQKKNVLSRLYTEATNITKIKWWTDQGNKYVVTDRDLYNEYRKQFKNIVYKKTWTKSKFVES